MALQNFGISPYFDDYNEDDRYLKILFRPGFAIQNRELNQMQTILQNQIQRFGNHVFENGSLVLNGETTLDPSQDYVRISNNTNAQVIQDIESNPESYVGNVVRKEQYYSVLLSDNIEGSSDGFAVGQYFETVGRSAAGYINSIVGDIVIDGETYLNIIVRRVRGLVSPQDFFMSVPPEPSAEYNLVPSVARNIANATVFSVVPVPAPNSTDAPDLTEARLRKVMSITTDGDPLTFYLTYSSGTGIDNDNRSTFVKNETLVIEKEVQSTELRFEQFPIVVEDSEIAIGTGVILSINEGVYYLFGYFHLIEQQDLVLKKYSTLDKSEKFSVGLYAEQNIVTPEENQDLLDNARGTTNFSAPGAHRYQVYPRLVDGADFAEDENYIETIRIERAEVVRSVDRSFYATIEDNIARRTYEESGDYVVEEFDLQLKEHANDGSNDGYFPVIADVDGTDAVLGDPSKLVASVGKGKAYVRGYESETIADTILTVDKARDVEQIDNVPVFLKQGNYINVKGLQTIPFSDSTTFTKVSLHNDVSSIGTAALKFVEYTNTSDIYRLFLFDIRMNDGESFADVVRAGMLGGNNDLVFADVVEAGGPEPARFVSRENGVTVLSESSSAENTLVFELPIGTANTLEATSLNQIVTLEGSASAGSVDFDIAGGRAFNVPNEDFFILAEKDTNTIVDVFDTNSFTIARTPSRVTISGSGVQDNATYILQATVIKSVLDQKEKGIGSVQTDSIDITEPSRKFVLSKVDGIALESVSLVVGEGDNAVNTDITGNFQFDGGQRDSFYGRARVSLLEGVSDITPDASEPTKLEVKYSYLTHVGSGEYFGVDSYSDSNYEDIPVYATSAGVDIPLANALDFRPAVKNGEAGVDNGEFDSAPAFEIDRSVTVDYESFLSRIDKIVINQKGDIEVLRGVPARVPSAPDDKPDSMNLYQLTIPPYTFDPEDIEVKKFDNRRFTMRDIGEIQNRVENLEYYTLLSLLEVDTVNKEFPDKFKSGFIVDNFETQEVGDGADENHSIATDIENKLIRPIGYTKSINLELTNETTALSNAVKNSDIVTLPFTEYVSVSQPVASRIERITKLLHFGWFGQAKLFPSSDSWHSRRQQPDLTLDGGVAETARFTQLKDSLGTIWNNWQTNWAGVVAQNTKTSRQQVTPARWVGRSLNRVVRTTRTTTTTTAVKQSRSGVVNTPITRTSVRYAGNRLVSNTAIPFMRSRIISFQLKGMKPNTPIFLFMDGKDITGFITETFGKAINEPAGSVKTDINGRMEGKFRIPNTPSLKIRTGSKSVVFTDSETGDGGSTSASTKFTSTGRMSEYQRRFVSTRILDVDTTVVRDSRTLTNTSSRSSSSVNTETLTRGVDLRFSSARVHHRSTFDFNTTGAQGPITFSGHIHGDFDIIDRDTNTILPLPQPTVTGRIVRRGRVIRSGNVLYRINKPENVRRLRIQSRGRTHFHNATLTFPVGVITARGNRARRDPTAQSFVIDSAGGGFLTGLNLYFGGLPADNSYPVTVQVRNMINGYPGPDIMPFADIILEPKDLKGSTDASVPTKVKFDAPVYLEADKEYCFVVLTDSPALTLWTSRLGDIALPYVDDKGVLKRNEQIVKQPNMGSLFRSQNNTTWTAVQEEDLKFDIFQARFETNVSGLVEFSNRTNPDDIAEVEMDPYYAELDGDGLETFEGKSYIRVHQENHGFESGKDLVTFTIPEGLTVDNFNTNAIDDNSEPTINGIPTSKIMGQEHQVVDIPGFDEIDVDYYYINITGESANASGRPDISDIGVNENARYSTAYFKTDEIKLNGTDINWQFQGNRNAGARGSVGSATDVTTNENISFQEVYVSSQNGNRDVRLIANLTSSNENLTPVIDIEQITMFATDNKINNRKDNVDGFGLGDNEVVTSGGYNAAARYILKKVDLINPANELRVFFDANVPAQADIDVFVRTLPVGSDESLDNIDWLKAEPTSAIKRTQDPTDFSEVQYDLDDIGGDFTSFTMKIVFNSTDSAQVPKLKNLRAIALKD